MHDGVAKNGKKTYQEVYDKSRDDVPRHRCCSCDKLETPSRNHVIKPSMKNLVGNRTLEQLREFLIANNRLTVPSNANPDGRARRNCANQRTNKLLIGQNLCGHCYSDLIQDTVPSNSFLNGTWRGEAPDVIKRLNVIESLCELSSVFKQSLSLVQSHLNFRQVRE